MVTAVQGNTHLDSLVDMVARQNARPQTCWVKVYTPLGASFCLQTELGKYSSVRPHYGVAPSGLPPHAKPFSRPLGHRSSEIPGDRLPRLIDHFDQAGQFSFGGLRSVFAYTLGTTQRFEHDLRFEFMCERSMLGHGGFSLPH